MSPSQFLTSEQIYKDVLFPSVQVKYDQIKN